MAQKPVPNAAAVTSFAPITSSRRGVTRSVEVTVRAAYSLVTTCTPSSRVTSTSRPCPEVIMLAATAAAPAGVRSAAAWASASASFVRSDGG